MLKNVIMLLPILIVMSCNASGDKKLIGGDRDSHGCIGSAGYVWCESLKSCERSWELAKKHGFENSKKAFDKFCNK